MRPSRPSGDTPAAALERFAAALASFGAGAEVTPAAVRDRLGASRKFVVPLLEWSDAVGLTVRTGDVRRVAATDTGARDVPGQARAASRGRAV